MPNPSYTAQEQYNVARQVALNLKKPAPEVEQHDSLLLDDFVLNLIRKNLCSTIRIKWENNNAYVIMVYSSEPTALRKFEDVSKEYFENFCVKVFNIDPNEKYNCCRSATIQGVKTRIFAIMPPYSATPNITISTTKRPPSTLEGSSIPDSIWFQIVHDNFIIVGPSGSGKTYLMNFLLAKFIKTTEQLGIIEEFSELIPPNEFTTSILVPPPKPGETHQLKFVTEQVNLMRLDMTVVGEVKGGEAWPLIVQGASGTRIATTVHGESAARGLARLRALCQLSCDNDSAIDDFIAKSVRYVIVMKNRRIEKVVQLTGTHNNGTFAEKEILS